jgi:methylenetetrahydrofolate reductase (NADPH)
MHAKSLLADVRYIVEVLTPRVSSDEGNRVNFDAFCEKYGKASCFGCAVSIPDNPLGNMRVPALSAVEECRNAFEAEKLLVNLNTFHTKNDLDLFLQSAMNRGMRHLLVVRGDGSPDLSRLRPDDLDVDGKMVTSIDLLVYIHREYPQGFVTGVAFNQYKPIRFEMRKLHEKIEKGAQFIVTQPVIGRDPNVLALKSSGLPLVVEAWMSKNIELLLKSVKADTRIETGEYDPVQNLRILRDAFPEEKVYLSLLSSKSDWREVLF